MDTRDDIREQIIEAARQIFSRYGFKKTTMDDIAAGIGKGKSSLYYYFSSKDQVFQAVVEKEIIVLRSDLIKVIESNIAPIDKIHDYVTVRLTKFGAMTNFYQAIKDELIGQLQYINQIRKKYYEDEIALVEKMLNEGIASDSFCIEDTRLAAIALVTALRGLEEPLFWNEGEDNLNARIKNVLHIIFHGIIKK
jgi:AcrR family transcriptional regulator